MVTEALWGGWQPADFHRYLDIVIGAFGDDRVMIGSDWPVCTLSGSYAATIRIVTEYVQNLPGKVQERILGANCARFYSLHKNPS
jgi:L-fuconolactonase